MPVLNYVAGDVATISSGSSGSCAIPDGTAQDLVILAVVTRHDAAVNTPSGWTVLGTPTGANARKLHLFWRAFSTTAASSVTVTLNTAVSALPTGLSTHRFSGVGSPYVVEVSALYNPVSGTTTPFPSLTIAAGNTSLLIGTNNVSAHTQPAGWTEHFDSATAGNVWVASREYDVETTTGSVSTTHADSVPRIGVHVELKGLPVSYVASSSWAPTTTVRNHGVAPQEAYVAPAALNTTTVPPHSVTPGPVGLTTLAIAPTTAVFAQSVVPQATFVAPTWFASQNRAYTPAVAPLGVGINPAALQAGVFFEHDVFVGFQVVPERWFPQTIVWEDHAIRPGPVTIGSFDAIAKTTTARNHGAVQVLTGTQFIAPATAVRAPSIELRITALLLEPNALGVYEHGVGQYLVLAEPDEAVWGASGGYSARVDFLDPAGNVIASTASKGSGITLVSGSIDEDCTQGVMRSVKLRLLLNTQEDGSRHPLLPAKPGDPLDPRTGGRMAVYCGPLRPSGLPDWVKLGVFQITQATASSASTGDSLAMSGSSLESELAAAKFYKVITITSGTRITDAILQLVRDAIPDVVAVVESSPITLTEVSWSDNDDRLKVIQDLARSIGFKAYFDREGRFRLHRRMIYGDMADMEPKWSFTEGTRATVRDVARELDASEMFNGVIVVGEPLDSTTPPVRAELWDRDPKSPTYYDPAKPGAGARGPRPKKIVSNLIRTQAQADAAAAAALAEVLTWVDRIKIDFAAQPKVECEDIVWVERTSMGVAGLYEVEHLTHDLLGAKSTATCIAR